MMVMYSTSLHPDVYMPNRNVYIGAPRNLSKDATEASFIIKKKWKVLGTTQMVPTVGCLNEAQFTPLCSGKARGDPDARHGCIS